MATDTTTQLELAWKKDRDPGVEKVLTDVYLQQFGESNPDDKEIQKRLIPYLHSDKTAEEKFYLAAKSYVQEQFDRLREEVDRDVNFAVVEEISGEHGNLEEWKVRLESGREITLPYVVDHAPEWVEDDLRRDLDDPDAEFVTVFAFHGDDEFLTDAKTNAVYGRVNSFEMSERECPYMTWDPVEREDTRRNIVKESDTWFGSDPGKMCRLCGVELGAKHGYIGMSYDDREVVFVKELPPNPSTVDSPQAERAVRAAFEDTPAGREYEFELFFEDGNWWVRLDEPDDDDLEVTYRVYDTARGFDFERV